MDKYIRDAESFKTQLVIVVKKNNDLEQRASL